MKNRHAPMMFNPILPRFQELMAKHGTDQESLLRLAEMAGALAAVDQLRGELFASLREEIDQLDEEETDSEISQRKVEQPRAPRDRGRPEDRLGRLKGLIIWLEFELATVFTNMKLANPKRRKERLLRKTALSEMNATRNLSKATLYRKKIP